jgi:serine/threonine protein kinase/multidrug resistance efflux pump
MAHAAPIPCPDAGRLRALLDDRLAADDQAALAAHLEACADCRAAFDQLAAESRLWDDARALADADPDEAAPPTLPHDGGAPACDPVPPDEHPAGLPFLRPSQSPDRLGRFGPYEVIELVGRGGLGVVLKAFAPALHRVVAVKVLAPQLAAGIAARRRFVREARAAASVAHEHVVTIHAVDEFEGWPYLVMQYVGGKSLQDRIDRGGPLEVKEILRIGMQAAQGLAAAHAQGLVHRDVKPANILLENGVERVKLADFGLARAVDDPSLTQAGVVAGTPQYMSPEQARGEAVDARADLFALGGVLYAMATGRAPFRGETTMAVLRKVSDEAPRPIRDSNPDVPPWLERIIMKLLAKDPAKRYQRAEDVADVLADRLSRLQQGLPIVASQFDLPQELVDYHDVGPAKLPAFGPEGDVGASKVRRPQLKRWHAVAALGLVGLMAVGISDAVGVTQVADTVATILRIKTPEGTLRVEIADPEAEVAIDDGDLVIKGVGAKEFRLKTGSHKVHEIRDGRPVWTGIVTIERGGKESVRVGFEDGSNTAPRPVGIPDLPPPVIVGPGGPPPGMRLDWRGRFEQAGRAQIAARAAIEQARANAKLAERRLEQAEAMLATVEREHQRIEALYKAGTIAEGERAEAQLTADQARFQLREASDALRAAQARLSAVEAERKAAEQEQQRIAEFLRNDRLAPAEAAARLVSPDAPFAEARKAVAQHLAEAAEAECDAAVVRVERPQAVLDARQQERDRVAAQARSGVAPQHEVDQAERRIIEAKSALIEAEAAFAQAQARLRAAQEALKAAESGAVVTMHAPVVTELHAGAPTAFPYDLVDVEGLATIRVEGVTIPVGAPLDLPFHVVAKALREDAELRTLLDKIAGVNQALQRMLPLISDPETNPAARKLREDLDTLRQQFDQEIRKRFPDALPGPRPALPPAFPGAPRGADALPPSFPGAQPRHEAPPELTDVPEPDAEPRDIVQPTNASHPARWVMQDTAIRWYLDEASTRRVAHAERMPMLFAFTGVNCANCRTMEQTALTCEPVVERLRQYVCARLYTDVVPLEDIPQEDRENRAEVNLDLEQRLVGEATVPLFVILDPRGRVVAKTGFTADSEEFARFLDEGLKAACDGPANANVNVNANTDGDADAHPEPPEPPDADAPRLDLPADVLGLFTFWIGGFW